MYIESRKAENSFRPLRGHLPQRRRLFLRLCGHRSRRGKHRRTAHRADAQLRATSSITVYGAIVTVNPVPVISITGEQS